jgi:hypothetical protein
VKNKMKKLAAILLVAIFVVSIPSAAASVIRPRAASKQQLEIPAATTDIPDWADGNISGVYAMKNETGEFVLLGSVFGYYHLSWGNSGYYAGIWETLDGSQSGGFSGLFFFHIAIGKYNITGSDDTDGFICLFKRNETDMTIQSVGIVTGDDDYFIRYALCSYTIFE